MTLTLLNIRSINKRLIDLDYDERLRKSNLICLTETQIMQRSQTEINSELKKFEIIHNQCRQISKFGILFEGSYWYYIQ